MLDIQITKTTSPKAKPADESKLGFGKIFTDHMFVMDYAPDKGWHDARIVPYQPFPLDPACVIFHYAQEIFEGLKAGPRTTPSSCSAPTVTASGCRTPPTGCAFPRSLWRTSSRP